MRPRINRFGALALILILLNIAGIVWIRETLLWRQAATVKTAEAAPKPKELRIISALPARDLEKVERLSFVFNENVPAAGELNRPIIDPPFSIEPRPHGYWVWSAWNRLDYKLSAPLPPGRAYTIKAVGDLESRLGMPYGGEREYKFQTSAILPKACDLRTATKQDFTFELKFNQRVDPAELVKFLSVWPLNVSRSSPLELTLTPLTREPAENITFRATRPADYDAIRLRVAAGLKGYKSDVEMGFAYDFNLTITPIFRLTNCGATEPNLQGISSATLYFTRQVGGSESLPVTINPPVEGVAIRRSGSSVVLEGRFTPGIRYTVTAGADMFSADGETLGKPQETGFTIKSYDPEVRFADSRGVLSPKGNLLLDMDLVAISKLKIEATRVYPNNIVAYLRTLHPQNRYRRDAESEDEGDYEYEGDYYGNSWEDFTSRQVVEKTLDFGEAFALPKTVALDLRKALGAESPSGVYRVTASDTSRHWTRDSAIVAITDLTITLKRTTDTMTTWVTSLATGKPAEGAKIRAFTNKNQLVAEAQTDANGLATLSIPRANPDGDPWVILAELNGDLSYLMADRRAWMFEDVDQSGRDIPDTYDVMLYTERGVYRPGDTIHLTGLIREAMGATPPAFPLSITLRQPDGRIASQKTLAAADINAAQGIFQADFPTDAAGRTGSYKIEAALPGSDRPIAVKEALVEQFLPVRIEVKAESSSDFYAPGQAPHLKTSAQYLFGQPAVDLPLRASGSFRRVWPKAKSEGKYLFGVESISRGDWRFDDVTQRLNQETASISSVDTTVGPDGLNEIDLTLPAFQSPGLWEGTISTSVIEPGGRTVSANASVRADTAGSYVGVEMPGPVVAAGKPVEARYMRVNGRGEPKDPAPMTLKIERLSYDYVWELVNSHRVWRTVQQTAKVVDRRIEGSELTGPEGIFKFEVPIDGTHRLTLTDTESNMQTIVYFYASSYRGEENVVARTRPERLEIVLDKDAYIPGVTATAIVRSPFPGTLYLTMENAGIVESRILAMEGPTASVQLPVTEALRGGAYLTASVIRAVNPADTSWMPHRANGLTRLTIDPSAHRLPLAIEAPAEALPGQLVKISARTSPPADPFKPGYVHLWAVDDGILLTTAFKTPDPVGYFHAPRKPAIETADAFGMLLPDQARPADMMRVGGDEDEWGLRNPVRDRKHEAAVVWRAALPVDAEGKLETEMILPNMTGRMRIMAVAVEGDRYGSAERGVTLAAPLMIEAPWPRAVAPGDEFDVPIKFFGSLDKATSATLAVKVKGPVEFTQPLDGVSVSVHPGKTETLWVRAKATGLGLAEIELAALAPNLGEGGFRASASGGFTVRPVVPLETRAEFKRVDAGQEYVINPADGFLPGRNKVAITVGAQPLVDLLPAVEELIGYPYGCIEQTTSKLLGILYAPQLIGVDHPGDAAAEEARKMVTAGLDRMWSMQTASGGFGYWPGYTDAQPWCTAYACQALMEARRAGYELTPQMMDPLLGYLERTLRDNDENRIEDNTRALFCRVLADFERAPEGWMATLGDRGKSLDLAGRADLAAAWLGAGKKDRALALLTDDMLAIKVQPTYSGSFTTQAAQEATLLGVLLDLDPKHPWIPDLVKRINEGRKGRGWWRSTRENAAAVTALARYQMLAMETSDFKGVIDAGPAGRVEFTNAKTAAFSGGELDGPVRITSEGKGGVYISSRIKGQPSGGDYKEADGGIEVRRRWLDETGQEAKPGEIEQGDMLWSEVTIRLLTNSGEVKNIAIVDCLPGAMEVENPRLATSAQNQRLGATADDAGKPDRIEFLDDRVLIFCSATTGVQRFVYPIRVTKSGEFARPPIQASCMYDPAIASISGKADRLKIER